MDSSFSYPNAAAAAKLEATTWYIDDNEHPLGNRNSSFVFTSPMKLAELLLQRVQLQNDLSDQAERIQINAQVLEDEQPLEDPELILKGLPLLSCGSAYRVHQLLCTVGLRTV